MTFLADSVYDLNEIADQILNKLEHKIVLFYGQMGTGKTTLIKKLVEKMGTTDLVTSPTYSLVNEYQTEKGTVYHFDFYRIKNEEEAYDMGWEEYVDSGAICLVEWPEKIPNLIPQKFHNLHIEKSEKDSRIITFK